MNTLDYAFCGLLALSALGHCVGTFKYTKPGTGVFVWSLSGSLAAFLIVVLNLLRIWHPADTFVVVSAGVSSVLWVAIVYLFGRSIKNVMDPRVLMHGVAGAGLAVMSLLALLS